MAKGERYKLAFKRRVIGRTDYYQRRALLQSGLTRFAVRLSGNSVLVQAINPLVKGDSVAASASSSELKHKYGWLGATGNLPSAYLTGLLAGFKAKKNSITGGVLDAGLRRPTKGSRLTAALKGIIDAGVEIPHAEEILPSTDRLAGTHVAEYSKKQASADEEGYRSRFSQYLRRGLEPANLPSHFEEVKQKILANYQQ